MTDQLGTGEVHALMENAVQEAWVEEIDEAVRMLQPGGDYLLDLGHLEAARDHLKQAVAKLDRAIAYRDDYRARTDRTVAT